MGEGDETDEWALAASERKRREREGDEALTGEARVSSGGSPARVGPEFGPAEGGGSFSFSFSNSNSFLLLFLFLFLFYSFSLGTKNIF
jgi:hypothetical protein